MTPPQKKKNLFKKKYKQQQSRTFVNMMGMGGGFKCKINQHIFPTLETYNSSQCQITIYFILIIVHFIVFLKEIVFHMP